MYKTSVYTLVNSNIKELAHRKQQKSQKVILFSSTLSHSKEALQVIWDNLPQWLIGKAVKDFSNKVTGGRCCSLELVVNTSNIRGDNGILAFDHYLTVLFQRCY